MKNVIVTLLVCLLFSNIFSQNKYEYNGRFTPTLKKDKLKNARYIDDVMPEFLNYVIMSYKERVALKELINFADSRRGSYAYPQKSFYPQQNYTRVMDYLSVEMTAECNGKPCIARSSGNVLTAEQKNMLTNADPGSDIRIQIKFNYKYTEIDQSNTIKDGLYVVTVVPATEAEYPGGYKGLTQFLTANILKKVANPHEADLLQQAIVKFTVNEQGRVVAVKIVRTSTDPKIDRLLLDAMYKMQTWKPAKNEKGITVKQEFSIPFGTGC